MHKDSSDAELIRHFLHAGDSEKKEILLTFYERYKNLVLKVCYHHLGDYDLANDVFHDVFVKVIENAGAIRKPELFKSWLLTIARNMCVDRLRRSSYLKVQEITSAKIEVCSEDRIEERYIAEMDRQKIMGHLVSCLTKLDPVHSSIFKLRWRGLHAAQILNIL